MENKPISSVKMLRKSPLTAGQNLSEGRGRETGEGEGEGERLEKEKERERETEEGGRERVEVGVGLCAIAEQGERKGGQRYFEKVLEGP